MVASLPVDGWGTKFLSDVEKRRRLRRTLGIYVISLLAFLAAAMSFIGEYVACAIFFLAMIVYDTNGDL